VKFEIAVNDEAFLLRLARLLPLRDQALGISANAFGGTNYSNTPVGAVCHVEEPLLTGVNSSAYLLDWEQGFVFAEAAWDSSQTPFFMAVGDPLVTR
jgi:hypothetical protein